MVVDVRRHNWRLLLPGYCFLQQNSELGAGSQSERLDGLLSSFHLASLTAQTLASRTAGRRKQSLYDRGSAAQAEGLVQDNWPSTTDLD